MIYVFPDQYHNQVIESWGREGFHERVNFRNNLVHTPRLNDFAKGSMMLASAMGNCPLSSPRRDSLLTGMYPNKDGVPSGRNSNRPISSLRVGVDCASNVFSGASYDCVYLDKLYTDLPTPNDPQWPGKYVEDHVPAWGTYTPKEHRHGFSYWYSCGTLDEYKDLHYWNTDGKRHGPYEWSPLHEADKVVSYLEDEDGVCDPKESFFITVGMNPPHSLYRSLGDCMEQDFNLYKDQPLDGPLIRPNAGPEVARTKSARYYFASVAGINRAFGQILGALKELGPNKDTVVIFSSGCGEAMCSQRTGDPKNSSFSESTNVPFIVHFPDKIRPRLDDLILPSPDVMPASLRLTGLSSSMPVTVQGHNYAPLFLNEKVDVARPAGILYIQNPGGKKDADGKICSHLPASREFKSAHRTLAFYMDHDGRKLMKSLLLDDRDGPYQMNSLSLEENKDVVDGLYTEMGKVLEEIDDPWHRERILSDMTSYGE